MKTKIVGLILSLMCLFTSISYADDAAGKFQILGIGTEEDPPDYVYVYTKLISSEYQAETCAQTDWWFPAGTTHVFWFPKADKYNFSLLLALSSAKGNAYIGASNTPITAMNGMKCKIIRLTMRE